jgi:hypothetical protein
MQAAEPAGWGRAVRRAAGTRLVPASGFRSPGRARPWPIVAGGGGPFDAFEVPCSRALQVASGGAIRPGVADASEADCARQET